jgi:hypothetical protein
MHVDFRAGNKDTVCKTIWSAAEVNKSIYLKQRAVLYRKKIRRDKKRFTIAYRLKLE